MVTTPNAGAQAKAAPLKPFRGGTQPTVQTDGYTNSVTLGATAVDLPVYNPSPNNLLRALWIKVTATTSGNAATVAFNGDMPLGVLSSITFSDANEKPIVGPFDSYTLAMINKYGGYDNAGDPRASAVYSAVTGVGSGSGGSFSFVLRIPIEAVIRNGVGTLENQSSASTFQLKMTVAPSTAIYSTAPTTLPSVQVQVYEEGYWKGANAAYSQTPKAAGSTQYWTRGTYNALNGAQQVQLTQGLGYPIRNIIEMNYSSGARSGSNFPDPIQYIYKGSNLFQAGQTFWKDRMSRQFALNSTTFDGPDGLDTGVFVLPYTLDFTNAPGSEAGLNYLPTDQGDLFQVLGTWNASSTLYHVVNYIAPVGPVSVLQATSA